MKKHKILYLITIILVTNFINAQDFQGQATYFSKIIFDKEPESNEVKSDQDIELEKVLSEAMKKASEKQFLLIFNKNESLYERIEELEKPEASNGGFSVKVNMSGIGKKYTNIIEKSKIIEDEIFGKEFLIVEKLEVFDWKVLQETKKIGNYTCYKAEVIIPVSENEKQSYQSFLKRNEVKPALFQMKEPKEKTITAWFTPEIPVSLGPLNYWGLPGLILELNEEKNIILCTKIVLSNKKNIKIKIPNSGKKVTQKEFDKIEREKLDSMKDADGEIIFQTKD